MVYPVEELLQVQIHHEAAALGHVGPRVAARALKSGAHSYKSVKSILEKGLDQLPEEGEPPQLPLIDHGNLRGSGYYIQKEKRCL